MANDDARGRSPNLPRTWGAHRVEEPTGVRLGCVLMLGLVLVGVAIGVVVGGLRLGGSDGIDLGNVDDYALASVVYRSTDGLFVVRLESGEVIALADVDPHNPPGSEACRVTFRPRPRRGERGRSPLRHLHWSAV